MKRGDDSPSFDYAVAACCLWTVAGFFLDAWAHGHVPIETFFTPYHAVFYSGVLALLCIFLSVVLRNRLAGVSWRDAIPRTYRVSVLGFPIFFLAGCGDLVWHHLLGLEVGVDALLSPTHQALGLGMFFLSSGPIVSVLARRSAATSLLRQGPLLIGLIAFYGLLHFGTAYAFDPGAARSDAPPPIAFSFDYLTSLSIGYYKIAIGVLVVIFQGALCAGFGLWVVSRVRPAAGFFTVLYPCANAMAAAPFTNDTPLLTTTLVASVLTGVAADLLVARLDPRPSHPTSYRCFATLLPMTYAGSFLLATAWATGVWWDWNVALGAWCWAGVAGLALSLLSTTRAR